MDLVQLAARLKQESGRSGGPITTITGLGQSDQRLVDWVRSEWEKLQGDVLWSWTRKSTLGDLLDGVTTYLPAAVGTATDCRSWWPEDDEYHPIVYPVATPSQKTELYFASYDWVRRQSRLGSPEAGQPQVWTIGPLNELIVYPAPAGDWKIDIDYRAMNTVLSAADSVPNMPLDFHMILVWGALMEVAGFDAAPEVYTRAKANFDTMRSALKAQCGPRFKITSRPLA